MSNKSSHRIYYRPQKGLNLMYQITNRIIDINFNIPVENLEKAYKAMRTADVVLSRDGSAMRKVILSVWSRREQKNILKGAKNAADVFNKLGFTTEFDLHGNLSVVGYKDITSFADVDSTLRAVASYVEAGSRIKWMNSEGDRWTEIFDGKKMNITDEIIVSY